MTDASQHSDLTAAEGNLPPLNAGKTFTPSAEAIENAQKLHFDEAKPIELGQLNGTTKEPAKKFPPLDPFAAKPNDNVIHTHTERSFADDDGNQLVIRDKQGTLHCASDKDYDAQALNTQLNAIAKTAFESVKPDPSEYDWQGKAGTPNRADKFRNELASKLGLSHEEYKSTMSDITNVLMGVTMGGAQGDIAVEGKPLATFCKVARNIDAPAK